MTRASLLQNLIDYYSYERYLEIGVYKGKTFLPLKCKFKGAVDPAFRIFPYFFIKWMFRNKFNWRNRYYQMDSDRFFEKKAIKEGIQDLIFVDGLHTFEASLKDVLNSFKWLDRNGIIVLHDCNPPNKAAATPASTHKEAAAKGVPGWTGAWCGDIWKTIYYLRKKYPVELEVFVLNADHGLGIVKVQSALQNPLKIDLELYHEIIDLPYEELQRDPKSIIGLRNPGYLQDFLQRSTPA